MALHTFTNIEYGIISEVHKNDKGFYVNLKDTDADEFFPMGIICPTEEMAIKKAKELVA